MTTYVAHTIYVNSATAPSLECSPVTANLGVRFSGRSHLKQSWKDSMESWVLYRETLAQIFLHDSPQKSFHWDNFLH